MRIPGRSLLSIVVVSSIVISISACSDTPAEAVSNSNSQRAVGVTEGPVAVFSDLVIGSASDDPAPQLFSMQDGAVAPLFDNTGFEADFVGWSTCKGGSNASGISVTTDAYEGAKAISMQPGNCFYRSAAVLPGDDLLLSCVAKSSDTSRWAALGLGFADESWKSSGQASSSLISTGEYSTYSVRATVPEGSSYASMWLYSDSVATIDNCTLQLLNGEPNTVVPMESSDNLIDNSAFAVNANDNPYNWYVGCDTSGSAEVINDGELQLSDNACVAQSLSNEDLNILRGNHFIFECAATNSSEGEYADIVIGFDGKESAVSKLSEGKYTILGEVPATVANGFVGMYSEATDGKHVSFRDCYLSIAPDADAEVIPLPDEPDPTDLDPDADPTDIDATETQESWPQPRDLDGDPSLAEVLYSPELDLSWLRMSAAGRDGNYGVEDFRGFVEANSVNAFLAAINAANYLGFDGWRLPIGHGQATVDCETQGDTSQPECYLEAGFMNQKMQEIHGGVAGGAFAYWPRRSRWVASTLSTDIQYYFEFDKSPAEALRFCGQEGLDQTEACETKFVWLVHDGDIGTPIE